MLNISTPFNYLVRSVFIIGALASLSGCGGMLADSMARSWVTGDTYGELAASLPKTKEGSGRVFLYRTNASTSSSLNYGIGLVKNSTLCTVDDNVYEIIWEVYRYVDLAEGPHVITCGSDVIKNKNLWIGNRDFQNYQRGANQISVVIENSADIFVRVDTTSKEPPYFQPSLVDGELGRGEIFELQYQEKGGHSYHDGKISM